MGFSLYCGGIHDPLKLALRRNFFHKCTYADLPWLNGCMNAYTYLVALTSFYHIFDTADRYHNYGFSYDESMLFGPGILFHTLYKFLLTLARTQTFLAELSLISVPKGLFSAFFFAASADHAVA